MRDVAAALGGGMMCAGKGTFVEEGDDVAVALGGGMMCAGKGTFVEEGDDRVLALRAKKKPGRARGPGEG